MKSCTDSDQDGEDSDISDDMETAKPTREDVALMAEGTQASAMLKRIQDNPIDLEDIISLLVAKMAILILPTCTAVTQEKEPSRARFEDHVIMPRGNGSEWLFETLSGVRLMPTSSSTITISDSIADNGEGPSAMAATKPTNKSTDNYTSNHGKSGVTNEHSVKELKLVNTSTSPIAISIESVGIIHVLLVDAIIPAPTVRQQYTLDKRSMGSNSGSRSTDVRGTPLKRRRRRRVTTEEDSRVVPDGSESDPNARARYKCNQCEKTFSRPYNLRSHRATHVGLKPFKCTHVNEKGDKCSWAFARKHDLVRHMSSRHAFEKPFKCTTCGAECGRNDSMKRHYEKSQICAAAALKKSQSQSQPQSLSPSPSQYQHRSQSPSPSPSQSQSQLQSQSQSQSQSQPQYQSQSQHAPGFDLGVVLFQTDANGESRPVAFTSRKLNPAECNYPTHEQELLAVVRALKT
ncbi:hypothetical protein BGX27_010209 [Mortierella sp. AM989]|nr:hypothetical protein BGX27_010209 [Mortierella sp. AM989]